MGGVRKCCVPGCTSTSTERYRLPNPSKEEPMLRQWIIIIGGDLLNMSMKDVYEKKRICKCHFAEAFYNPGGKGLLRTAVPTIHIPNLEMNRLEETTCICHHCPTKIGDKGVTLFRIPNDPKRSTEWLQACNREDLISKHPEELYNNHRLCERHFEDKYFFPCINDGDRKQLLDKAIPTIFPYNTTKFYEQKTKLTVTDEVTFQTNDDTSGVKNDEAAITTESQSMDFLNTIPKSTKEFKSSFVHDICRTCLCQLSPSTSKAIFTSRQFHNGLSKILSIQVNQDDMLPKNLCLKCFDNLKVAISFKKSAEAANEVLKQKLRIAKSQNVQSVEERLDSFCDEIFSLSQSRELPNQINETNNENSVLLMESFNQNGRHDNTTILSKSDDQVNTELDKLDEMMIKTLDVSFECNNSFQEVSITDNKQNEVDLDFVTRVDSKDDKQLLVTQTNLAHNILNSPDTTNNSSRKKSLGNRVKSFIGNRKIFIIPLRRLYSRSELKRHINADLKNREAEPIVEKGLNSIFKCLNCGKTHYNRNLIINHMKSPLKKYTCEYCGNSFNEKQTYTLHLAKIHKHTSKSCLCYICGKTVSDISSHIKAHNTKKTIKCPVEGCDVFVKYNRTLASHIKQVHTKETVCICEQCGQQFSTISALRFHLHKHSEDWRFKCETCDMGFFYRSRFKSHLLTHFKQKLFDCPVCSAKFSAKTSIRKHCITHHPDHPLAANTPAYLKKGYICPKPLEKVYKCPHCRKVFGRECFLKKHIRNHHEFK